MDKGEAKTALSMEELDFLNLVLMLGNTASVELGDKKPKGGEKRFNLPRARQFINMLAVLDKRTEGHRTAEEERVFKSLLFDLQAKYVRASGLDKADPEMAVLSRLAAQAYSRQWGS